MFRYSDGRATEAWRLECNHTDAPTVFFRAFPFIFWINSVLEFGWAILTIHLNGFWPAAREYFHFPSMPYSCSGKIGIMYAAFKMLKYITHPFFFFHTATASSGDYPYIDTSLSLKKKKEIKRKESPLFTNLVTLYIHLFPYEGLILMVDLYSPLNFWCNDSGTSQNGIRT